MNAAEALNGKKKLVDQAATGDRIKKVPLVAFIAWLEAQGFAIMGFRRGRVIKIPQVDVTHAIPQRGVFGIELERLTRFLQS